ncbi:MAG: hypothetical protein AAF211_00210 [Myxococcota bacterium]
MDFDTNSILKNLFQQLQRDVLADVPLEQRDAIAAQMSERLQQLLSGSTELSAPDALGRMVGLGEAATTWSEVSSPIIEADFEVAVTPSQLQAAADLYFIYQHERMKIFDLADVLIKLFHEGRMRLQEGPGAWALYRLERWAPLRYDKRARWLAYKRVFNYGPTTSKRAVVNTTFHSQYVSLISAIAQYFRDTRVTEVIASGSSLGDRPFFSQATIERFGTDLRWRMDRTTHGNIVALTLETGNYLRWILGTLEQPDIMKAFDANTKWDVIEMATQRHLGGTPLVSQRVKMAEAGRAILHVVAANPFQTVNPDLFRSNIEPIGNAAEQWLAAYRMTPEGKGFGGIKRILKTRRNVISAAK